MIANIIQKMANNEMLTPGEALEIIEWFAEMQNAPKLLNGLFEGVSTINALDQITNNMGVQIAGKFLAPADGVTNPDPLDPGFTGAFMTGEPQTFSNGVSANIGGVDAGVFQYGLSKSGIDITAEEYDNETSPLRWLTDAVPGVPVGYVFGTYLDAANQGGVQMTGQGRDSGDVGFAAMTAITNSMSISDDSPTLLLTSQGALTADMEFGTDDVADSSQTMKAIAKTRAADQAVVNTGFSMNLKSKGTPAAGFGVKLGFNAENGSNSLQTIASIQSAYTTVTDDAETATLKMSKIQGGTSYEYVIPGVKYVLGDVSIGTSETTIFDLVVPAEWLEGENIIIFGCDQETIATTARNITWRNYYDDTAMMSDVQSTGTNTTAYWWPSGTFSSTGADAQRLMWRRYHWNNTTSTGAVGGGAKATATEDTATAKNVKFTGQMSGATTTSLVTGLWVMFLDKV